MSERAICAGSGQVVKRVPASGHVRCQCGRIVSVVDGKIREHFEITPETRYEYNRNARRNAPAYLEGYQ